MKINEIKEKLFKEWFYRSTGLRFNTKNSLHSTLKNAFMGGFETANSNYDQIYQLALDEIYDKAYNAGLKDGLSVIEE